MNAATAPADANHWHRYASRWPVVAAPLCPHVDDVAIYARELSHEAATLLLGVTPQITALPLRGIAVDISQAMIDACPPPPMRWTALKADWRELPLPAQSIDQVAGDGSLTALRYPDDYILVFDGLKKLLQPHGKGVLRLFIPPPETETISQIEGALWGGHIGSFHAFKWRLMMSQSHASNDYNVPVTQVLEMFNRHFADRLDLSRRTSWPAQVFDTIDIYRDSNVSLSFPPRELLSDLFRQYVAAVRFCTGGYELAERCPIAILEGWLP